MNGCSNMLSSFILCFGSFCNSALMRSMASEERYEGNVYFAMITFVKVLLTACVSKGGVPTNKVYSKQPRPQTSASNPWDPLEATSGDIKFGVPHIVLCFSSGEVSCVARPKSAIFYK